MLSTTDKLNPRFKPPPTALEAENAILSVLIKDQTAMDILRKKGVDKSNFQSVINQNIYSALKCLEDDQKEIDIISVKTHLQKKHHGDKAISDKLIALCGLEIPTFNLNTHVDELVENKQRRECYFEGLRLVEKSHSQNWEFKTLRNQLKILTAKEIVRMTFTEQHWIAENLLPEGLSILCGRPKLGKSRLALDVAVAVALGGVAFGKIPVNKAGVLYLALEDSARRLNKRLNLLLQGIEAPENLFLLTEFQTITNGGLEILDQWLTQKKDVELVIVDTLAKIKGGNKRGDIYAQDYETMSKIKKIADKNKVSILLVHHTRKATADDYLDTVSGTTGITGAVDTVLLLQKDRGSADAVLHVTGRDIEEQSLALLSDDQTLGWTLLGNETEFSMSKERRDVVDIIRDSKEPVRTKDIAASLGKNENAVTRLLTKLSKDKFIKQSNGRYILHPLYNGRSGNIIKR